MSKRSVRLLGWILIAILGVGLALAGVGSLAGRGMYALDRWLVPEAHAAAPAAGGDGEGVLVAGVDEGSPAEEAGLRRGDVILAVDDEEVNDPWELRRLIAGYAPGDTVTLTVLRCEETMDVVVTLGARGGFDGKERTYLGVRLCCPVSARVSPPMPIRVPAFVGWGQGARVIEVQEGSPAERAGLRVGDVILAVDDEEVSPKDPLPELIRSHEVGDTVELRVERGGEELTLAATLAEHPDEEGTAYLGVTFAPFPGGASLFWNDDEGMLLLPDSEGFTFIPSEGMPDHGLVVMRVAAGSPAEEAGLRKGDVILAVDGEEVKGFDDLREAVRAREPGDELALTVLRDGEERQIEAILGEHPDEKGKAYLGITGFAFFGWGRPGSRFHFGFDEDEFRPRRWRPRRLRRPPMRWKPRWRQSTPDVFPQTFL